VAHIPFSAADVVRHELVTRIVEAYDGAASAKRNKKEKP
jgi:phosphate starvation-inducible protein PhoH